MSVPTVTELFTPNGNDVAETLACRGMIPGMEKSDQLTTQEPPIAGSLNDPRYFRRAHPETTARQPTMKLKLPTAEVQHWLHGLPEFEEEIL